MVMLAFGPNGTIRDTDHPAYRNLTGAPSQPVDSDGNDL
jgi:hypothetical protein